MLKLVKLSSCHYLIRSFIKCHWSSYFGLARFSLIWSHLQWMVFLGELLRWPNLTGVHLLLLSYNSIVFWKSKSILSYYSRLSHKNVFCWVGISEMHSHNRIHSYSVTAKLLRNNKLLSHSIKGHGVRRNHYLQKWNVSSITLSEVGILSLE